MKGQNQSQKYKLQDFYPLIIITSIIIGITFLSQIIYGYSLYFAMRIFMASFFLIFGGFKVINLAGFAKAYAEYDLIAQAYKPYGYVYPFLEIALGIAYLIDWNPTFTNAFTLVLMLISATGVFNELRKGKQIVCACLGVVFKIPMTYVTLFEDLLMAAMALYMLLS